jgi:bifunctional NMN adenylyltransferase/nudix hydrolase
MAHTYDLAVFIGRFQPFHMGHYNVIHNALEKSNYICILVGSANSARCYRNPFTFQEREQMIRDSVPDNIRDRMIILPLEDFIYNESKWIQSVQNKVSQAATHFGYQDDPNIVLVGHSKDHSSYYLKLFPQWNSMNVPNYNKLNSSCIRNAYFSIQPVVVDHSPSLKEPASLNTVVPTPVHGFLNKFMDTTEYKKIQDEQEYIRKYRASWNAAPYPPIFVTVDAVVVQSGHVLLVRRGANPGKGLWAMPGGFINQYERIQDAVIRELREETGIKVPDPVMRGSIVAQEVFDDPYRSERGRTVTHCFLIKLKDDVVLPRVKGMDDADKAKWEPIADLKSEDFFEDHYHVIMNMISRI